MIKMELISPILSICIPTFNRSETLRSLLNDLFDMQFVAHEVEILISDNASSDLTAVMLDEMSHSFDFRYFIQADNIGPTENYKFLIQHCTGEYAWIVGDDDLIYVDRTRKFISKLANLRRYPVFILDTATDSKTTPNLIGLDRYGEVSSSYILRKLICSTVSPFGHYTSFLFLVSAARRILLNKNVYLGSWPHQYLLLNIIGSNDSSVYSLAQPLAKQGNPTVDERRSLISWLNLEADRFSVLLLQEIRLKQIFQIVLIFRELYSARLLSYFLLISWLAPRTVTPLLSYGFYFKKGHSTFLAIIAYLFSLPLSIFFLIASCPCRFLNLYSRLFIAYCKKYELDPLDASSLSSSRYL